MTARIAAVAVAAVLLAGCGGGEMSREEYAREGNAVCREYNKKTERLGEPTDLRSIARIAKRTAPLFEDARGRLADLDPPEALRKDHDAFLEAAERTQNTIGEIEEAARDGDQRKVVSIAGGASRLDAQTDRIARRLGLTACAED